MPLLLHYLAAQLCWLGCGLGVEPAWCASACLRCMQLPDQPLTLEDGHAGPAAPLSSQHAWSAALSGPSAGGRAHLLPGARAEARWAAQEIAQLQDRLGALQRAADAAQADAKVRVLGFRV